MKVLSALSAGHPNWRQTTSASLVPKLRSVAVPYPWFRVGTSRTPEHSPVSRIWVQVEQLRASRPRTSSPAVYVRKDIVTRTVTQHMTLCLP